MNKQPLFKKTAVIDKFIGLVLTDKTIEYLRMEDFWLKEDDVVYNERTDSEHIVLFANHELIRVTRSEIIKKGDLLECITPIYY